MQKKLGKVFNIDLNVTRACNFDCTYCFAEPNVCKPNIPNSFDLVDKFIIWVKKFIESNFFIENYDALNIGFWGGEPTLKFQTIKEICDEFEHDKRVKFSLFTNGKNMPLVFIERLYDFKGEHHNVAGYKKWMVQVSYDGDPIQSLCRGNKNYVLETIHKLDFNHIPFVIKSTIPSKYFHEMFWAYRDISNLNNKLKTDITYHPTIDYYSNDFLFMKKYGQELKKSLIKIAVEELKLDKPIFTWFQRNRKLCTAGRDMIAVDTDGRIYTCHACFYGNNSSNLISHIERDPIIITYSKFFSEEYNKYKGKELECEDCPVAFCLRCNYAKFCNSKKEFYLDKWHDYKSQSSLCHYYKINNLVREAYLKVRREREKNDLYRAYK